MVPYAWVIVRNLLEPIWHFVTSTFGLADPVIGAHVEFSRGKMVLPSRD